MFTILFLLQLLLTLFIGSLWIYLTTIVSKHFGTKVGGFIGGLPSTALLSFFFIGLTQSPEIASEATVSFPLVYGITGIFLVIYAWLAEHGFVIALTGSLIVWIILSTILAFLEPRNFILNVIFYIFILLLAYIMLELKLKVRSKKKVSVRYTSKQIAFRSLFGGAVITSAVLFSKIVNPLVGGMLAAFPAMFISTLTITYKAHSIEFSRAMTKPLMVTGMITIVIYVISVRYFYLSAGLYLGTLISIAISGISAFFTYHFIQRKLS